MGQVLEGIRVLDFGRFIAAPWCAAVLGDLGADVIRIERRDGGEDRWFSPVSETGDGSMFLQCNRNKRSLTLDPASPEGRDVVRRLVETADVVIVNLPEPAMKALGLDYESLKAIKSNIIVGSCTAYGTGGPYSDKVGYDGVGQVMGGGVYRSGTPEAPMRSIVSYVDYGTAMNLATGIVSALFHRERTGEGQQVETALLATALMMTNPMIVEQAVINSNRVAMGNRGPSAAPADLYRVTDGWVLMQVVGTPLFKRWCRMLGEEQWIDDPRFANDEQRGIHGAMLNDRMQDWCLTRTKAEVLTALDAARIPGAPLYSPQDVLGDPHIAAMQYLNPTDYPGLPLPAPITGTPFQMSATPGSIRVRAPLPGEHSNNILLELGFHETEIAALREKGIV